MDFLVNDLSLSGQFASDEQFFAALGWLMRARQRIERQQFALRCHRGLAAAPATGQHSVRQLIQRLRDRNRQRQVMSWLFNRGPFWDDDRLHSPDDYLAVGDECVTDTAIAEAAMHVRAGSLRTLVSLSPSAWQCSPIEVAYHAEASARETMEVRNLWTLEALDETLHQAEKPLQSWPDLIDWARRNTVDLVLADDVLGALDGWPFVYNAAREIQRRLQVLSRIRARFTDAGQLDAEGLRLREEYFVGDKAWFTDSSAREKHDFKRELTFAHPRDRSQTLFCPWHGKVKIRQMRIHFSYPIVAHEPIYVVYIGPKITKR